jgi:uncharacterized Zn-finger protein
MEQGSVRLRPGRKPKVLLPVTCPEEGCRRLLETTEEFVAHQGAEHPGSLVCPEAGCLQRFDTAEELAMHAGRHGGERPFRCSECQREYSTRQDLRLHFRKHTGRSFSLALAQLRVGNSIF